MLFADWGSEHRLGGKQGFELCERCVSFRSPLELVRFLHQSVKRQCLFTEARDESTQSGQTTSKLLTSCTRTWRFNRRIAPTFSGFASIPHLETRKLSNLPPGTPNVHFDGLSLISYLLRLAKLSARSVSRLEPLCDLTTMSSIYASTFRLI